MIREVLSGVFKWYLRFKDVLGRSYLDRPIEVIKGRKRKEEPALLKTRSMDPDVADLRGRWKRLQKVVWRAK